MNFRKTIYVFLAVALMFAVSSISAGAQGFKDLIDLIEALENRMKDLDKIGQLENRLKSQGQEIAGLKTAVANIASNAKTVTAGKSTSASLKTHVETLAANIESLSQKTETLYAEVENLKGAGDSSESLAEYENITSDLRGLVAELRAVIDHPSENESEEGEKAQNEKNILAQPASEKYRINGQLRFRQELDGKSFNREADMNDFGLLRSRIGITFTPAPNTSGFVQFQDSRVFGIEGGSTLSNGKNLDLHQGYIRLDDLFGKQGMRLQIGRMEINYGGQRLVGAVGWHNVARSFDGAKVSYSHPKYHIEAWSAKLAEFYDQEINKDKSVAGVDFNIIHNKKRSTRGYIIYESDRATNNQDVRKLARGTFGLHSKGNFGTFDYDLEAAYQNGSQEDTDISAYMIGFSAGYSFNTPQKPRFVLAYDHLSGNDASTGKIGVFNTLYATNHKFYGFMDYFLNIPLHTQGFGLRDFMVKGKINLSSKHTAGIDMHVFKYAEKDEFGEDYLGNEFDFALTHAYSQPVKIVFGASVYLPQEVFKRLKGDKTTYWAYTMVIINF